MGYLQSPKYNELKALVNKIKEGTYMFIYESPDRWGVYLAASNPYSASAYTVVMIDIKYDSPGENERVAIYYDTERAHLPVVDTHGIKAIYNTKEEADEMALRMIDLIAVYKKEIASPLLKLEMGIAIELE